MWKIFVENVDFFTSTKDTVIYKYVVNVDYYIYKLIIHIINTDLIEHFISGNFFCI